MENKRVILLLSGGIDSTTLLAKLTHEGYDVTALSFSYGQKHRVELEFASRNAKKYGVVKHVVMDLDARQFGKSALVNEEKNIATYENGPLPEGEVNVYVPFRNLVFTSHAFSLAETLNISEIFVAFNKDDSINFWDCRPAFIHALNAVSRQGSSIEVKAPFIELSKTEVVLLAQKLGVVLDQTISCYQPVAYQECGICLSCRIRQLAINGANGHTRHN